MNIGIRHCGQKPELKNKVFLKRFGLDIRMFVDIVHIHFSETSFAYYSQSILFSSIVH
jgi:hypothetical protein